MTRNTAGKVPKVLFLMNWKTNRERRTHTDLAVNLHVPPMHLGDVLDDGQPETSPAHIPTPALVDSIEAFKESMQMLWFNARPSIDNAEIDETVLNLARMHLNRRS